MDALGTSICLLFRSILLSARWAKQYRQLCCEQAKNATGEAAGLVAENLEQRDVIELQADTITLLQRRLKRAGIRRSYSVAERLHILWCAEYYGSPRRQLPRHQRTAGHGRSQLGTQAMSGRCIAPGYGGGASGPPGCWRRSITTPGRW